MTIETRTTIQLKDIKAIEFECAACHTKMVFSIGQFSNPMMVCNVCQPPRILIPERSTDLHDIKHLVHLINRFSQSDGLFLMRFDISDSSASREGA